MSKQCNSNGTTISIIDTIFNSHPLLITLNKIWGNTSKKNVFFFFVYSLIWQILVYKWPRKSFNLVEGCLLIFKSIIKLSELFANYTYRIELSCKYNIS